MARASNLIAWAVAASVAGPAHAEECPQIEAGPTVATQPDAWRAAIEELRTETGRSDKPWGCTRGSVDLVVHGTGATLIVRTADGLTVSRELDAIEDLVPLGEAILTKPEPSTSPAPLSPPSAAPAVASPAKDAVGPKPKAPRQDPWLVASAVASPRYAGSTNALFGSVAASIAVPIARWVPSGWVRFDGPIVSDPPADFVGVSLGGGFGRVFSIGDADLTPSIDASAAIEVMADHPHEEGYTKVDGRLGADARVAYPRKSPVRAVFTSDFEVAPGELAKDRDDTPRAGVEPRKDLPTYTVGLGIGIEIAPR